MNQLDNNCYFRYSKPENTFMATWDKTVKTDKKEAYKQAWENESKVQLCQQKLDVPMASSGIAYLYKEGVLRPQYET